MTKVKMTIHRGLSELKLIDDRINKGIAAIVPSGVMQKDKKVNNFHDKKDFDTTAKSALQSVKDLMERKSAIKSAIVASNGVTKVLVAGHEMTVADAITAKDTIKFKKSLYQTLLARHKQAQGQVNLNNEKITENALALAEATVGKENVKNGNEQATELMKVYTETNEFHLVDPLEVEKLAAAAEAEISEFESEVDAVLSESNAVTFIEV